MEAGEPKAQEECLRGKKNILKELELIVKMCDDSHFVGLSQDVGRFNYGSKNI